MKPFLLLGCLLLTLARAGAQPVDSIAFFADEPVLEMKLVTDLKGLQNLKGEDVFQDATVTLRFPDSSVITEPVQVGPRGKFRRGFCRIPPIMIQFRSNKPESRLNNLGKLKMVIACGLKADDEELLLKEYLVYKIYNLLEEKSFQVRLLRTTYEDSRNRVKAFTQYSFLIEDDGDMARRNNCKKKEHGQVLTEGTNRALMTKVAIFQYMISNTDWSVPNNHNVKLIFDRNEENTIPYAVPYDFDYCGLVDAAYAVPHEIIGTSDVKERVYRGFPRNMDEIQLTLDVFRTKKQAIFALVSGFERLSAKARKTMTSYLEDFFKVIENKNAVKNIFIDNARTE